MSSDVIRPIPLIYDSRGRSPYRACPLLPIISSISSSHPLSFLAPPPSSRLSLACLLSIIPRPRAWEAPTNRRSAIAGVASICLLPIIPCRSLAPARSLLPPPMPSLPRCHLCRSIRPVRFLLIVSASSSRHHACGSCPPRLSPRPTCRGTGRGYGLTAGCGLFGCRRLACLPHAVSRLERFGRSLPSRLRRHLVMSCFPACAADDGCVRCRVVAFACLSVGAF